MKSAHALLNEIEIVFVMQKLSYNRNGIMNSVLNKVDIMRDIWGYSSTILLCDPSENLPAIRKALHRSETRIVSVYEYFGEDEIIKECGSNAELAAKYFERTIKDDKFYILVVEDSLYAEAVTVLKMKNIAKVIVVHSILFQDPYDPYSSEPQLFFKYLCANPEKFDAIIFLTHDERRDFYTRYGSIRNTFVIPHAYPYKITRADFEKRDHRKAVMITRLVPVKRMEFAIEIFAEAAARLPEIRLEIYGVGGDLEKCKNLIDEFGMKNNIFLKGFTDDPAAILKTSALSMMTSPAEGYPLSLIESICNGCPAFSFDIKHGPSEIISDGITGYLIPTYDKEMYVSRLTEFLEDIELQREMSDNAYEEARRFGPEVFLESWYGMMETLYNRKSARLGK